MGMNGCRNKKGYWYLRYKLSILMTKYNSTHNWVCLENILCVLSGKKPIHWKDLEKYLVIILTLKTHLKSTIYFSQQNNTIAITSHLWFWVEHFFYYNNKTLTSINKNTTHQYQYLLTILLLLILPRLLLTLPPHS